MRSVAPNRTTLVSDPLGDTVEADWRLVGKRAVIEMARASGLAVVGGADEQRSGRGVHLRNR